MSPEQAYHLTPWLLTATNSERYIHVRICWDEIKFIRIEELVFNKDNMNKYIKRCQLHHQGSEKYILQEK